MTDEQFKLMAGILDGLCKTAPIIDPYMSLGVNLGCCGHCGAIGKVRGGSYIELIHEPTCLITLNEQLQRSLPQPAMLPPLSTKEQ